MLKRSLRAMLALLLVLMMSAAAGCADMADAAQNLFESYGMLQVSSSDDALIDLSPATTATAQAETQGTEATTTAVGTTTTAKPTTTTTTAKPTTTTTTAKPTTTTTASAAIDEKGVYTKKDDVALYIYTFGHLPDNFITKAEARSLGWSGGSLEPYAPGYCIGGDKFGNYEGLLPKKKGRSYTECDIDTLGKKSRGAKRIVFSNDGLIYYTDDHYESFTLLYGKE